MSNVELSLDQTVVTIAVSGGPGPQGPEGPAGSVAAGTLEGALELASYIDLASEAVPSLGSINSNLIRITGTTNITGFGTAPSGVTRWVRFAGALTLTHNATSLILPGSTNITTAANDTAMFVSLGSGNWLCHEYKKANGKPVVAPTSSDVTTALGYTPTSITGLTGTQSVANFKTGLTLVKGDVGLGNVDNTSDANKPISTATQTALNAKQPLDSDLTAIAALTTQSYGRSVLTTINPAGLGVTPTDISGFGTAVDDRITLQKGALSGVAPLDSSGKISSSYLPAIALTDVYSVSSQVAQLALTAQEGDVAIRTDLSKTYIHNGGTSGTMSDWSEMAAPTTGVTSFNTRTGAVTLTSSDVTSALTYTPGNVAGKINQFAATTSSELAGKITDETGTGSLVFAISPTLVSPVLGAASGTSLTLSGITAISLADTAQIRWNDTARAGTIGFRVEAGAVNFNAGSLYPLSYSFFTASSTGLSVSGSGAVGVSGTLTTNILSVTTSATVGTTLGVSGAVTGLRFTSGAGSVGTPAFGFSAATGGMGFYLQGPTQFGVAVNSVAVGGFYGSGFFVNPGMHISPNGENEYIISNNNGEFDFYSGSVHNIRLTPSALEAKKQIDLQAGQIKFPSTPVLSTDANTLDDYEEGTFTPGVAFGGASTGITYSSATGFYQKIGHRVTCDIIVTLSSKGSSTGDMTITGLPFLVSPSFTAGASPCYARFFTGVAGEFPNIALAGQNTTTVFLYYCGGGNVTSITDAHANANAQVRVTVAYVTNS